MGQTKQQSVTTAMILVSESLHERSSWDGGGLQNGLQQL